MFGLGFQELLVVFVVALLVFGPKRLPELAKVLGRSMGEFRKTMDEMRFELTSAERETLSPTAPNQVNEKKIEQQADTQQKAEQNPEEALKQTSQT